MIFRGMDIMKGMEPEAVDALNAAGEEKTYGSGDMVFCQGDSADSLYILVSGALKLHVSGTGHTTHRAQNKGEILGWSSVVGREFFTASAQCTESATLIRISSDKLEEVLKQYPESGLLFYKQLAQVIGERLINCYRLLA